MQPTYTLTSNGYQPINMIPTGEIKCIQCDQIRPISTFDFHSRMHVSAIHRENKPYTTAQPMSKIALNSLIKDDDGCEDIGIKSVLPD